MFAISYTAHMGTHLGRVLGRTGRYKCDEDSDEKDVHHGETFTEV